MVLHSVFILHMYLSLPLKTKNWQRRDLPKSFLDRRSHSSGHGLVKCWSLTIGQTMSRGPQLIKAWDSIVVPWGFWSPPKPLKSYSPIITIITIIAIITITIAIIIITTEGRVQGGYLEAKSWQMSRPRKQDQEVIGKIIIIISPFLLSSAGPNRPI